MPETRVLADAVELRLAVDGGERRALLVLAVHADEDGVFHLGVFSGIRHPAGVVGIREDAEGVVRSRSHDTHLPRTLHELGLQVLREELGAGHDGHEDESREGEHDARVRDGTQETSSRTSGIRCPVDFSTFHNSTKKPFCQ